MAKYTIYKYTNLVNGHSYIGLTKRPVGCVCGIRKGTNWKHLDRTNVPQYGDNNKV